MAFSPTHLSVARQREIIESRLQGFEAERLQHGLDLVAVDTLDVNESNSAALQQDKVNLTFAIERLDAQLASYGDALDALPAE